MQKIPGSNFNEPVNSLLQSNYIQSGAIRQKRLQTKSTDSTTWNYNNTQL